MENLPNCPKCNSQYIYEDGILYICPECGYEFTKESLESSESEFRVKDSNGNSTFSHRKI